MTEELSVIGRLILKTQASSIKWYSDTDSTAVWRRTELASYSLNLNCDSGTLTVSSGGTVLNTYTGEEVADLKDAVDAYLAAQLAEKASAFEDAIGEL